MSEPSSQLRTLLERVAGEWIDGLVGLGAAGIEAATLSDSSSATVLIASEVAVEEMAEGNVAFAFTVDGKFETASLRLSLPTADARSIAALLTDPAGDATAAREATELDDGDKEQLDKVGAMAAELLHTALQDTLGEDIGVSHAGTAAIEAVEDVAMLAVYAFAAKVGNHDAGTCRLLLDQTTAEAWNGDGELDDVFRPSVPTRGRLACYLGDAEPFDLLRRAGRRVGLDLDNRPTSEVPNPAVHRGKLVLIDVPARQDHRISWCKRLKEYDGETRVVLLLRQPSKPLVVSGFLAKADLIVGLPIAERDLAAKLGTALEGMPAYA